MNVLITGTDGFIGKNLFNILKSNKINVFKETREKLDLHSFENINSYIVNNKITHVIHCAIKGGKRLNKDEPSIVYENILMYENLIQACKNINSLINIASGAEFDRRFNIFNANEHEIYDRIPIDYYGLSKNIIAKRTLECSNGINLRLFGCFYHNESNERFFKNNITRALKKLPLIIHNDIYMDFVYIEDLAQSIIQKILNNEIKDKDINICYEKKYKLSELAEIINSNCNNKEIIIENKSLNFNYTGNASKFKKLNLISNSMNDNIKNCIESIKKEIK